MQQKVRLGGFRDKSWGMSLSGLALIGLLSGCGGGGSSSVDAGVDPVPTPSAVSGVVADGYLQGATVCLDTNGNKICDADEPTAVTGLGGKYTLDAAALALLPEGSTAADYPILVEVPATAIDEDTDAAVGQTYVMAAPAGKHEFVSPITTLVQNQIESNPALTAADAEIQVKAQIGVGADSSLFEDYVKPVVANKTEEQIQARQLELEKLHKVAQVVARTMAKMKTTAEAAAQEANLDLKTNYAAIVKLVTDEVMTRLQTINDAVGQTTGTFNPQTVVSQIATIDGITVATRIEEKSTVIVRSSFAKMLEGEGTFWLDHWTDNGVSRFEYGNVKLPAGTNIPVEGHFTRGNGAWQADSAPELPDYILTEAGWQEFSEGASSYTVTFNAVNGSALLTHTATGLKEVLSAIELDLNGKSHKAIVGQLGGLLLNPVATFPQGAKGYRLTFMPQQDIYTVHTWTNSAGVDENYVRYWNQNQEVILTDLNQLKTVFAKDSVNYLHLEGNNGASLAVQFGTDGQLYCFKQPWDWSRPTMALEKPGSWKEIQVFGQTFIKLMVPDMYKAGFRLEGDPLLVMKDGFVKRGEYRPAGVVVADDELNYNKLAFDSLAGNLNYDYVPAGGTGGTDTGTGGVTNPGTGGGSGAIAPPPAGDILPISRSEFMDRTFAIQEAPGELTLATFLADGNLKWMESVMSMNGAQLATNDGTWSVNPSGHLELVFPGAGTITLRKHMDSTSGAMRVYYQLQQGGQTISARYQMLESTVSFSDPSGLTLVGSDGVTVTFNPAGNGTSGSIFDPLDNSNRQFDWALQNGVLTLNINDGTAVTLYQLANGSSLTTLAIVGIDRDATGAVVDVFHEVLTIQ